MLRNSHKDQRKGDKLVKRFVGPYAIEEYLGKGFLSSEQSWYWKSIKEMCKYLPTKRISPTCTVSLTLQVNMFLICYWHLVE